MDVKITKHSNKNHTFYDMIETNEWINKQRNISIQELKEDAQLKVTRNILGWIIYDWHLHIILTK